MPRLQDIKSDNKPHPLGTMWVALGEGSTWRELATAFVSVPPHSKFARAQLAANSYWPPLADAHTNLLLTGSALTPYDRQRWELGNVE